MRRVLFSWGSARLSSPATRHSNESWSNNCHHFSPRSHGWVGQRHSGTSNSTWTSFGVWETFKSLRDWVCSVCILKYFNYFKKFNIFRFSRAMLLHAFFIRLYFYSEVTVREISSKILLEYLARSQTQRRGSQPWQGCSYDPSYPGKQRVGNFKGENTFWNLGGTRKQTMRHS